jgi:hypothetical protein
MAPSVGVSVGLVVSGWLCVALCVCVGALGGSGEPLGWVAGWLLIARAGAGDPGMRWVRARGARVAVAGTVVPGRLDVDGRGVGWEDGVCNATNRSGDGRAEPSRARSITEPTRETDAHARLFPPPPTPAHFKTFISSFS